MPYRDEEINGLSLPLPAVVIYRPARPVFVEIKACKFALREGVRLKAIGRTLQHPKLLRREHATRPPVHILNEE